MARQKGIIKLKGTIGYITFHKTRDAHLAREVSRLTQSMVKVIQADTLSDRGLRNVIDGEAELLTGFDFNINGKLGTSLFAAYTRTIDSVAGTLDIDIPTFIPANMIAAPGRTTHFKVISGGAEIDFENEASIVQTSETAILPWNANVTAVINLSNVVTTKSRHP